MNGHYFFKKTILVLTVLPFFYLTGLSADVHSIIALKSRDVHKHHHHNAQPRVYINQGLYRDYNGNYYNSASVHGNTIIQQYHIPPAREPLRSPGSVKGPLTIDHLPPRQ